MKQTSNESTALPAKPGSMEELLRMTRDLGATDLHLTGNMAPAFRVRGLIEPYRCDPYTPKEIQLLLDEIMAQRHKELLRERLSVDLGLHRPGVGRFRVVIYYQRGFLSAAVRLLADGMPSFTELGLPESLARLPRFRDGLVLVTGATGSGKSTTLATIIDEINRSARCTIFTIEDPIEYVHANRSCIVFQRELHTDVTSFAGAMSDSLRQDPDVILVGEMRDPETIRTAITASETGHLVFSTLHARDATSSVNRIIGTFPAGEQNQIRQQLSASLRAVVSQRLLPSSSRNGRVPAVEIMFVNTGIANLIRHGKDEMIYSSIETGLREGMQTMEQSLIRLVQEGRVSADTALSAARRPDLLRQRLGSWAGAV
ncbi:MAG: PilT/PilU family type 4a pilus ATPase [Desulfobulbaceae bacterium]|nr:PilT/PilU family type 4a pilus ATPase [Desulfobulbaceae bacterium]